MIGFVFVILLVLPLALLFEWLSQDVHGVVVLALIASTMVGILFIGIGRFFAQLEDNHGKSKQGRHP